MDSQKTALVSLKHVSALEFQGKSSHPRNPHRLGVVLHLSTRVRETGERRGRHSDRDSYRGFPCVEMRGHGKGEKTFTLSPASGLRNLKATGKKNH